MIFQPTGTSDLLIKAVKPHIHSGKLLDLGCGCGKVGKALSGKDIQLYASDVQQEAIDNLNDNSIIKRCGSLFEPWQGIEFDYIVDDVSGVAESIARMSPWFKGVPCDSGWDGTDLVCKVISQAPKYLTECGKLFFPIVSLSNKLRIVQTAVENFNHVKCIATKQFPLPREMYDVFEYYDLLQSMRLRGEIDFKEAFGQIIFWTDIYIAQS